MKSQDLQTFIESNKVAWEAAGDGVRRKILGYDESLMLVLVEFDEGAFGSPHRHPHIQVSYVVRGSFEVEIDGKRRTLFEGDSFYVPSDCLHGAVALEPSTLIDTFAPMREDYVSNGRS